MIVSPACNDIKAIKFKMDVYNIHAALQWEIISRRNNFELEMRLVFFNKSEGYFPLGGIFRAERHFLLFKDQLAESGRQKTKENIIPRGKFRLVENDPYVKSMQFEIGLLALHHNSQQARGGGTQP